MEANQKKNFVCKFCNKRYPCGKSLGGHIRIHFNGSSNDADEEAKQLRINNSFASYHGNNGERRISGPEAGGGQSGYVLRENPKKTSRFTIDWFNNNPSLPEKVCKECGKGFQSLKALCGHMACHSKNNNLEDHSGTSEKLKELVTDSASDTDTSAPSKKRTSKRTRYKTIGVYSSSSSPASDSLSSTSDNEVEQAEVAMCLMMLSRDSGFKGCFSFAPDYSDNNSVVLETKSSTTKLRVNLNNHVDCVFNGDDDELIAAKKPRKKEVISAEIHRSENSDSGCFRNGPRKLESKTSPSGFNRNGEITKLKAEFGSRSRYDEDIDAESAKRLSRFRRIKKLGGKNLLEGVGYDQVDRAPTMKSGFQKLGKSEFPGANAAADKIKKGNVSTAEGGRVSTHKKDNRSSDATTYGSGENSVDTDYVPSPLPNSGKLVRFSCGKAPMGQNSSSNGHKKSLPKKGKVHECPFCSKVFRSGQALGGHKRSHFVGGAEDRTVVIKQEVPEISMCRFIDLNLPVAMEEEADGFLAS